MNEERRQKLNEAANLVDMAKAMVDEVLDAERDVYDSMPENFQNAERGTNVQAGIDSLEESADSLDTVLAALQELA